MDAPRRFPFIRPIKPRFWLAVMIAALATMSVAIARDHSDNPNLPDPDDLVPAEIAEPEEAEKAWQEAHEPLPPFPRAEDLLPLRADAADPDYNYYIDVNSVSLTTDEVLRYTIIIQSPRGASNIVYEGIRCATKEIKSFAYGTRDGRFKRMADPQWTHAYGEGPLGYRTTLVETYVCDENGWSVDSDTVLERLVLHDPRRPRFAPRRPEDASDGPQ